MKHECVNKPFSQKKKDGCQFCVNKKKDGCLLRQQTPLVLANEKAPSHGAGLTKQFTNSSQKGLLICICNLQVHCYPLQVEFYKSMYKCIIVNLQVKLTLYKCRSVL